MNEPKQNEIETLLAQIELLRADLEQVNAENEQLRTAFELQQTNYIRLYNSVLGEGCFTSDVKDIDAIAAAHREEANKLRADKERLDWLAANSETNSGYSYAVLLLPPYVAISGARQAIDSARRALEETP